VFAKRDGLGASRAEDFTAVGGEDFKIPGGGHLRAAIRAGDQVAGLPVISMGWPGPFGQTVLILVVRRMEPGRRSATVPAALEGPGGGICMWFFWNELVVILMVNYLPSMAQSSKHRT
jgi:hypothetical protein